MPSIPRLHWDRRFYALIKACLAPAIRAAQRPARERYLASPGFKALHVGCGDNLLPGWLNVDKLLGRGRLYFDAARPFPFPSGTFDYVFHEHFIQYLSLREGERFLRECRRVLKPGGVMRSNTLELGLLGRLSPEYVDWASRDQIGTELRSPCLVANNLIYGYGFRFLYDRQFLGDMLGRAGFSQLVEAAPGQSAHPRLQGLEGHGQVIPEAFNRLETFVIEASACP